MRTALREARGVDVKEAPIRAWLAAHQGALPMPFAEAASSSSGPSMALLQLSDFDEYEESLQQQLSESPDTTLTELKQKLVESYGVSCLDRTMQSWLERARSSVPKRAIKRGWSDLPTLEDLDEYGDYLRGLLAEDPSLRWRKLREAIKTKGVLVSERTMRNWLDRCHREIEGERARAVLFEEQRTNAYILESLANRRKPLEVLTASRDHDVMIWRPDRSQEMHTLYGHTGRLTSAVFSQDMRWVLTASHDKTAKIWPIYFGHTDETQTLSGHTDFVLSAMCSQDGASVLTASSDNTAKIWNASTGECIQTLRGQDDFME